MKNRVKFVLFEIINSSATSMCSIRSLSGLYTVVCLREGKRGTCLGPLFATVMCEVPCFQRDPTAIVMYKQASLLSRGPPTSYFAFKAAPILCFQRAPEHPPTVVMCKYLAFKGAQITVMHKHFSF